MDIHPPDAPVHSFRSFLVHIAIVTVGILIALSLEGVRETFHNRHLVRETRENFRVELEGNRENIGYELKNTHEMELRIDQILKDLPRLRHQPEELALQIAKIEPSFWFLSSGRWESALSTGALAHMSTAEVARYADSTLLVQTYTALETQAEPLLNQLHAYFEARQHLNGPDLDAGVERLLLVRTQVHIMIHVGEEVVRTTNRALKND